MVSRWGCFFGVVGEFARFAPMVMMAGGGAEPPVCFGDESPSSIGQADVGDGCHTHILSPPIVTGTKLII